jgi:hypothetical protein
VDGVWLPDWLPTHIDLRRALDGVRKFLTARRPGPCRGQFATLRQAVINHRWSYALGNRRYHRGVRAHEPRAYLMEWGIYMRDGSSTTEDTKSAGPSPLRLRVGVFLILLWIVPFWALAPYIAHSLSGLSNPPSVAAVTTTILVVQTIVGLLGFWVAGAAVKSIIKGSTMRHALRAIWSMLIHGDIRGQGEIGNDPNEGRPPREDA